MKAFLKKHNYLCLSCMILVTCLVLYRSFFGENVLAYIDHGYDTFHQYVPAYQFFAELFKKGFSIYDFSYGLGTNIFIAISWIADPFSALNVIFGILFGVDKVPQFLVYNQILKVVCAGLLCNYYLRNHQFSRKASAIASYCFAFSGYMLTAGQHYFFAVHPIYFLALLICIDKAMQNSGKIYLLIIVSFLTALRSPYSAYMIFIGGAVYVICLSIYVSDDLRTTVRKIVSLGSSMVLGLCTAMFCFLPQAEKIINSYRVAGNEVSANRLAEFFQPASAETLRTAFLRLFSNQLQGTPNNWQGVEQHFEAFPYFFSAVFVLFAVQFFVDAFQKRHPKKTRVLCAVLLAAISGSVFFDFIPTLFNVFVQPQYRFVFVFLPMFAVMTARTLDHITDRVIFSRFANRFTALISIVLLTVVVKRFYVNDELTQKMLLLTVGTIVCGAILLELLYFFSQNKEGEFHGKLYRTAYICLFLVICINLFVENDCTLYYGRRTATREMYEAMQESTFNLAVSTTEAMEGDHFYRMETDAHIANYADAMFALQSGVRSLSVYDTRCNGAMGEFLTKMYGNTLYKQQIYYLNAYNPTGDIVSASTLGLKYLYSFNEIADPSWTLVEQYEDAGLYKNTQIETAGLLYNAYTSQETADNENISERQLGLTQRVILENPPQNITEYAVRKDQIDCHNAKEILKATEIKGKNVAFEMQQNEKGITLTGTASEDAMLTVPLEMSVMKDSGQQFQIYVVSEMGDIFQKISSVDGNGKEKVLNCELYECGIEEEGKFTYTYSVPYGTEALNLIFEEGCGTFEISSMELRSAEIAYTGDGIRLLNPNRAGKVQGTVTAEQDSILYLPIPYDKDWKAMVDGEDVPIYRANYGFCAILLSEGMHEVCLSYTSGALAKGLQVSLFGCIIIFLYGVFLRKKNPPVDFFRGGV